MALKHWILRGETPIEVSLEEWMLWNQHNYRFLGITQIGGVKVTTVFLGVDYNFSMAGPPLLFETMVFNEYSGKLDQIRHSTYQEALDEHMKICDELAEVDRLQSFGKQEEE